MNDSYHSIFRVEPEEEKARKGLTREGKTYVWGHKTDTTAPGIVHGAREVGKQKRTKKLTLPNEERHVLRGEVFFFDGDWQSSM